MQPYDQLFHSPEPADPRGAIPHGAGGSCEADRASAGLIGASSFLAIGLFLGFLVLLVVVSTWIVLDQWRLLSLFAIGWTLVNVVMYTGMYRGVSGFVASGMLPEAQRAARLARGCLIAGAAISCIEVYVSAQGLSSSMSSFLSSIGLFYIYLVEQALFLPAMVLLTSICQTIGVACHRRDLACKATRLRPALVLVLVAWGYLNHYATGIAPFGIAVYFAFAAARFVVLYALVQLIRSSAIALREQMLPPTAILRLR